MIPIQIVLLSYGYHTESGGKKLMMTERLINLRKEVSGRRQADVAKVLKISASTYSTYEQGTREADHAMLVKIANYYGVSTDYLLDSNAQRLPLTASDLASQITAIKSQLNESNQPITYSGQLLSESQRKTIIAALDGVNLIAASMFKNS